MAPGVHLVINIGKPAEILLYEYLAEQIDAAVCGDVLYKAELHDTPYQRITGDRGVRISEAVSEFAPGPEMKPAEFDAAIIITCFSRVKGVEKTARQPALQDVFDLSAAVFALLTTDFTLGGRVCDLVVHESSRGYDTYNGEPYAVSNIPITINPSGTQYPAGTKRSY